ncbi:MAG: hypothetical protein JXR52_07460 [Bacteroidales bacterium]|nr:hypothetical protein [Bacteroidales bacterium]
MFKSTDFDSLFREFTRQKVMIIGDVMIDTYLWGNVSRVSPEAPVPIVSGIMEESRLGGAANVALNIKAMGAVPILCSIIGGDERGSIFLELLEEQNLSDVGLIVDDERLTTQKTRIISARQHLLRVDEEMDHYLSDRTQRDFLERIHNLLENGGIDSIIFQDYDKGILSPNIIREVTEIARNQQIPVLVDPKFRNFHTYKNITLFKPNFRELLQGLKLDLSRKEVEGIAKACIDYQARNDLKIMMVTLSEKGILVTADGSYTYQPAMEREITDVSGAGDTVISVASLCLNAGLAPAEIAAVSNLAGGQVCEHSGVVPVNAEQLIRECRAYLI